MKNSFELTTWYVDLTVVLKTAAEMANFKLPDDTYIGGSDTDMDLFLIELGEPSMQIRKFIEEEWVIINLRLSACGKSWTKANVDLIYDVLHEPFGFITSEWEEVAKHFKE